MKKILLIIIPLTLGLTSTAAYAENNISSSAVEASAPTKIKGHVRDSKTGEALIGATVRVKGTAAEGTVTDIDGNFTFTTSQVYPLVIEVGFMGYEAIDVAVGSTDDVVVNLREEDKKIDEVVVVGYGTQRRTQLTGSVTKVGGATFDKTTSATLDGALGGAVAGLNVTAASWRGIEHPHPWRKLDKRQQRALVRHRRIYLL